ncbi:RES family NAD+ phosphorylase [Longimicrobium sp.]|uniref:RES family NAD+ phosphorylase n=1 Tax=Longimicrobium sp. TaxID=2029185 RepID=UPI002CDB94E5|nr:RES family NAD+ phosphorylase [Longimicrobium sp.]HSU15305.1 RES family NAD+ phosphorylase [Longimicrobium sp.]
MSAAPAVPPDDPGPPPHPPADLFARDLPIHAVPAAALLYRIHSARRDPLFFGPAPGVPPRGRWDAPGGEFRVCYLAEDPHVAFAETFLREPGMTVIEEPDLVARSLAGIEVRSALRLAAMHGPGLARAGATAAVCTGPYAVSRAWALALHEHPAALDGIRYRARHDDDGFAIALFDRSAGAIVPVDTRVLDPRTLADPIAEWLDRYGMGLI